MPTMRISVANLAPYFNLGRQWKRALSMGILLMIAGNLALSFCCPGISAVQASIQAALATAYILFLLHHNLKLSTHPNNRGMRPSLGAANWITLSRGGLIALLAGFLFQPCPGEPNGYEWAGWIPGGLYLAAAAGDVLDGWVARITANQTPLGELLDTRMDAMGILVASLLAITYGQLPVYYFSAGLAYYLLRGAVWVRRKAGRPCNEVRRRKGAKLMAAVQMAFLGIVLLPLFSPPVTEIAAPVFLIPFLAGFLVDWQMVCRHGKITPID